MRFDPPSLPVLFGLTLLALAYLRALDILNDRGHPISRTQKSWFWLGWIVTAIALIGPIDTYSAELLWVHMTQHILLADVAGPLLLLGLRTPVIVFFWPRFMLVWAARNSIMRGTWHVLTFPPVALTIWLVVLFAWHIPAAYELALTSEPIHILEHASFVLTGALVWWPIIDPMKTHRRSGLWKAGYLVTARVLSGALATVMIVAQPLYPAYAENAVLFGLEAQTDQQIAGAIMMFVDFVLISVVALALVISTFPADDAGLQSQAAKDS